MKKSLLSCGRCSRAHARHLFVRRADRALHCPQIRSEYPAHRAETSVPEGISSLDFTKAEVGIQTLLAQRILGHHGMERFFPPMSASAPVSPF